MHSFLLPDLSCGHCVAAITEALKNVYGDQTLAAELEGRTRR